MGHLPQLRRILVLFIRASKRKQSTRNGLWRCRHVGCYVDGREIRSRKKKRRRNAVGGRDGRGDEAATVWAGRGEREESETKRELAPTIQPLPINRHIPNPFPPVDSLLAVHLSSAKIQR